MQKRAADIIVETLVQEGITHCFSVVGGGAMHLNNAFAINDKIQMVYNHHEQASAMAAEGYARMSGQMAAVCVTSGPGGTNAINGVQGAYVDSIPMIVISGYPRYDTTVEATGLSLRARGVQENDVITMVKKITKYAKRIYDPCEVEVEVRKAIHIALSGRRGPVWIDVPLNVQGAQVNMEQLSQYEEKKHSVDIFNEIEGLKTAFKQAKRPCILTGSGIRSGNAWKEYKEFLKCVKVPVVGGSLQADINAWEDFLYYGMSGSSGPRTGNFILQNSDFILVLGNSLSFKQTGFRQDAFAPHAKICMVDANEEEAKKDGLHVDDVISCQLKDFFDATLNCGLKAEASEEWIQYCNMIKETFPQFEMIESNQNMIEEDSPVAALDFWKHFLNKAPEDAVIALGNSSCVGGVLIEGIKHKNQRVLVNYNCGSMGHDIPNAIGAAVASGKSVTLVTGDGSIMMNLQELQTISHYKLPIHVVVFTNHGYNAIRNTCKNFFHGTYTGCDEESGVSFPQFSKVADTFGLPYKKCSCTKDLDQSLDWLAEQEQACLLEIVERMDELPGLKTASTMQADGSFLTDPIHDLSPKLEKSIKNNFEKYM